MRPSILAAMARPESWGSAAHGKVATLRCMQDMVCQRVEAIHLHLSCFRYDPEMLQAPCGFFTASPLVCLVNNRICGPLQLKLLNSSARIV